MDQQWEQAVRDGDAQQVRALLQDGAEINSKDQHGLTALMLAVINQHAEIVRLLVRADADVGIRAAGAPGLENKTALDLARDAGRQEIIAILRSRST